MADEKKTCFVIMPITVPPPMAKKYHDGKGHFQHVYDHLFKPCIVKAGYEPISPKAEGSDLIHAGIIGNLRSSDLVLCDMSCLNPNVFFEWGIRTALNRPVCIVKDELATFIPFDIGVLNYQEYSSKLQGWEIEAERDKLIAHLTASAAKAGSENSLWKYLGPTDKERSHRTGGDGDGKPNPPAVRAVDDSQLPAPRVVRKFVANKVPEISTRDFKLAVGYDELHAATILIVGLRPLWEPNLVRDIRGVLTPRFGLPVQFSWHGEIAPGEWPRWG